CDAPHPFVRRSRATTACGAAVSAGSSSASPARTRCGDVIAPGVVIRAQLHEELVVARGDRFDDLNAGLARIVTPLNRRNLDAMHSSRRRMCNYSGGIQPICFGSPGASRCNLSLTFTNSSKTLDANPDPGCIVSPFIAVTVSVSGAISGDRPGK